MIDYHVHSNFSPDAIASLEDNTIKAIELQFQQICFTDHMDYEINEYIRQVPFVFNPKEYLSEISRLKIKYSDKIKVLAGVEIGLQPHMISKINELIANYHFDFILGSVHNVGRIDLYTEEILKEPAENIWTKYFTEMLSCIKEVTILNSIGHFDLPKRYYKQFKSYDINQDLLLIKEIFIEMINREIALEINTGGYSYGLSYPNPSIDFIDLYISLGGKLFTIGSDSHSLEQLGRGLYRGVKILYDKGIENIATFENQGLVLKNIKEIL